MQQRQSCEHCLKFLKVLAKRPLAKKMSLTFKERVFDSESAARLLHLQ